MLGLRLLWRDWRGGELGILAAALVIAVATVTGISLFADRLQQGIVAKSNTFLAADRVLQSPRPIDQDWLTQASGFRLQTAQTLTFASMVYSSDSLDAAMQLSSIKAVSDAYPLKGNLEITEKAFSGITTKTTASPSRGEVWVDPRLLPLLGISVGDPLYIGEASFRITKALVSEPDGGSNVLSIGTRVMMNVADIDSTGVIQPASRVKYRYLFAGNESDLSAFGEWLKTQLEPSHRWLGLEDTQPRISQSLQRAEEFLLLAGALGVGLAGIAIALAARRYSERHYDYVAMMKSLGASSAKVLSLYLVNLLLLSVVAIVIGCGIGWLIQEILLKVLQQYFDVSAVPALSLRPFAVGAVTALICLLAFAMPPLVNLQRVSPLMVLRRDMTHSNFSNLATYGIGTVGIALLMYWYSGNLKITLGVLAGVSATVVIVGFAAWFLLRGTAKLGMQAGSSWRLALASIRRRGYQNAVQAVIFSLSIMLLLLLALIRSSLIDEWQVQLPEGTPNHFLLNISEQEKTAVEKTLDSNALQREPFYAMVRGRITAVNGQSIADRLKELESDNEDSIDREANLSWSDEVPNGNKLVAGQWWDAQETDPQVSMEERFANRLAVKVGDRIEIYIGSEKLDVRLSSIRQLDWDSMQPNFFMVFPTQVLNQYPATYLTSFYLPKERKQLLNSFLQRYPTVTVIEMDSVIRQIRSIITQVSSAIELVLGLIIISGLLVLVASVQSSLDSRLQESAILRTLGANRRLVLGSLVIEFASLGFLAGIIAAFSAELSVYALQEYVLNMEYVLHPWVWVVGPVVGALLIGSAGFITCRKVVNTPPVEVLRAL